MKTSRALRVLVGLLFLACIAGAAAASSDPTGWTTLEKGTFGIGLGQGYGGAGFKYETKSLADNITATVAPGLTASNAGVKYYLPVGSNPGARSFFAVRYGIQMTGLEANSFDSMKTWTGFSVGFGRRWSHWEVEAGFKPQPSSWTAADERTFDTPWIPAYAGFGWNF